MRKLLCVAVCTGTNYGQVDCENGKICCGETTVKIDGVCGTDKLSCQAGR